MKIFVTGIGTDVGKTVISAILVEALQADYWKPIQSGDLHFGDAEKVQSLVSNTKSVFHPNAYRLNQPMSPHAAAALDGVCIDLKKIVCPKTSNHLVIEGAGGLLVPLNDKNTIIDLIAPDYKIILVSRNYLGSINHTLMSLEVLKNRGLDVAGLIFNGLETPSTENIIQQMGGVRILGRVNQAPEITKKTVQTHASIFKEVLKTLT
ncbi:MAG: dethiobiotin synthase [Flavobacteriaceae bacterium]|nr:dethiobiotin synthase [Flavobacteriaceae bacterium]